jgi:hypothetical protein
MGMAVNNELGTVFAYRALENVDTEKAFVAGCRIPDRWMVYHYHPKETQLPGPV